MTRSKASGVRAPPDDARKEELQLWYEQDGSVTMEELQEWLRVVYISAHSKAAEGKAAQYADAMVNQLGLDSAHAVRNMTVADLQQAGVMLGHAKIAVEYAKPAAEARTPEPQPTPPSSESVGSLGNAATEIADALTQASQVTANTMTAAFTANQDMLQQSMNKASLRQHLLAVESTRIKPLGFNEDDPASFTIDAFRTFVEEVRQKQARFKDGTADVIDVLMHPQQDPRNIDPYEMAQKLNATHDQRLYETIKPAVRREVIMAYGLADMDRLSAMDREQSGIATLLCYGSSLPARSRASGLRQPGLQPASSPSRAQVRSAKNGRHGRKPIMKSSFRRRWCQSSWVTPSSPSSNRLLRW